MCWLAPGQAARWKLRLLPDSPGNAVKLRRIFMPAVNTAVAAAASGAEGNGNEGGGEGGGEGGEGGGEARLLEHEELLQVRAMAEPQPNPNPSPYPNPNSNPNPNLNPHPHPHPNPNPNPNQAEDGEHVGHYTASEGAGMVRAALGGGEGRGRVG